MVEQTGYCQRTGKRCYPSRSEATRVKAGIHRRGGYTKGSTNAYLCRACGMWHLGREK